jgi:hypothetical protein
MLSRAEQINLINRNLGAGNDRSALAAKFLPW